MDQYAGAGPETRTDTTEQVAGLLLPRGGSDSVAGLDRSTPERAEIIELNGGP